MKKLLTVSQRLQRAQNKLIKGLGDYYLWNADWITTEKDSTKLWAKEVTIERLQGVK